MTNNEVGLYEDETSKSILKMVNENAEKARLKNLQFLEEVERKSLIKREEEAKINKIYLMAIQFAVTVVIVSSLVFVTSKVIDFVTDHIDDNKTDSAISEMYGTGFVDGATSRITIPRDGFWYDYSIISNAILTSEDPVYTYYNTINDILGSDTLSDADKLNCLNELSSYVYRLTGGAPIIGKDCTLLTAPTWTEFLSDNHFLAEDDILARKYFQEYIRETYKSSLVLDDEETVR